MSLAGRVSVLVAGVCSFVAFGAQAATNIYLKFEAPSIEGTATSSGNEKQIELLSFSHGAPDPHVTVTKYLDTATDTLLRYCWGGKQIGKATLTCYRSSDAAGGKPIQYLKIEMQHVVISDFSIGGGPGDVPVEKVSLDYGTVKYTYFDHRHADDSASLNVTASGVPTLKASAAQSGHAPCTATLASGKSVDVHSLSVGKSSASFAASGASGEASGPVKLTCGKASVALSGAKIGSANGKVTATGGTMQ